jgi:hypothetical protein
MSDPTTPGFQQPPAAPADPPPAVPAEPDPDADPQGSEALGEPGKKALDEMKAQRNAARDEARQWREVARDFGLTPERLRESLTPKPETPPDAEAIRRQAEREADAKANARVVNAEIRAAATGKLADPSDALRYLDPSKFEVGSDGSVDSAEIAEAIDELLASKSYLGVAKEPAPRFAGGADGGPRGGQEKSLDDQIAEAMKAGNTRLALHLQNQKLVNVPR